MPDSLRTLGIVAHIDAGKTTLTERILHATGVRRFPGHVDDGTAAADWMRQEQERGISIVAAAVRVEWRAHRLQIVDTPGHVDFTAEVARTLRVLDAVVVVLDGVRGVESQTESVWRQADQWRCARLAFVNKLDRPGADFGAAVASLAKSFDCLAVPVVVPLRDANGAFAGLGLPVTGEVVWFDGDAPESEHARLARQLQLDRDRVVESCAEVDEAVLAAYVAGCAVSDDALTSALRRACIAGRIVPVLGGAALHGRGIEELLDAVCAFLPSPVDRARDGVEAAFPVADESAPARALVFKVEHDAGEVRNYLRVFAGTVAAGDPLFDSRTGEAVVASELWSMLAVQHEVVPRAVAGEIVVVPGHLGVRTGDTLSAQAAAERLPVPTFPRPVLAAVFEPASDALRQPLIEALDELCDDDPTLTVAADAETGLPLVSGMGELHLEIAADRIRERLDGGLTVGRPRVALRASVARPGAGQATVADPSHGGTASAAVELAPAAGDGLRVRIDEQAGALAGADHGLQAEVGTVLGAPAIGVELRVVAVRRDPSAPDALLQQALRVALEKAAAAAGPVQYEPVLEVEVWAPEESLSVVLDDLCLRQAHVRQVSSGQLGARVEARGRLAAFLGYATRLRSLTRGRAEAVLVPVGYEPSPGAEGAVAAKI